MEEIKQKACIICGAIFYRDKQSRAQFDKRQTCSRACGSAKRLQAYPRTPRVITENKDCIVCGTNYNRKRNLDDLSWSKQRFCARACWYKYASGKTASR